MGQEVVRELSICTDCLMWQANGDDSGLCNCARCEGHNSLVRAARCDDGPIVVGDEDYGFSYTACDLCTTPLAGDRHAASVLATAERDTEAAAVEMGEALDVLRTTIGRADLPLPVLSDPLAAGHDAAAAIVQAAVQFIADRLSAF